MELQEPLAIKLGENNPQRNGNTSKLMFTLKASNKRYVFIPTSGTNTPTLSTGRTSGNVTKETSGQLKLVGSPTLTSSVEDFHVKHLVLLENEGDLTTPEELYSLTSHGFSKKNSQDCVYWKTSKDCYLMTMAELSRSSSPRLLSWGMMSNGKCVTQRISVSRKTGSGCSLSDILEEHPDHKYFLSPETTAKLLSDQLLRQPVETDQREVITLQKFKSERSALTKTVEGLGV